MAIDGILLHFIQQELEPLCGNARVDRIFQPGRETILLSMRCRGGGAKILLSASPQSARVHLTRDSYENPGSPPMFCMLMRKHLSGAKLSGIEQAGLDRILTFVFQTHNELGDPVALRLACEVMGRHSNIILIGSDGRILDAVKRVDPSMSSVRQVLPGMAYAVPPAQDKINLLTDGPDAAADRILARQELPVEKAAMNAIMGISPIIAHEIAGYVSRSGGLTVAELPEDGPDRLRFFLRRMQEKIQEGGSPTMLLNREGRPKDVSFLEVTQVQGFLETRSYASYGELLDAFYAQKDLGERMKQRSGDLFRTLANLSERIERRLQKQREELLQSEGRESLRIKGDLLNANLYRLEKGAREAVLENFYEEGSPAVTIPLDIRLTPSQNAQKYYAEYRRADTAEKILREQIGQGEAEYAYIDTVMDSLMRAASEAELDAIREELSEGGYLRKRPQKEKRPKKLEPARYRSSDGFLILRGRGNLQNDRLTMKEARKNDVWFHTQNIPGSHVIVVTEGKPVPNRTLEEAAKIAAGNSKAGESALVPVDYTEIRNVRKPAGARPGFVLYVNYQTAIVTPDPELEKSLAEK